MAEHEAKPTLTDDELLASYRDHYPNMGSR